MTGMNGNGANGNGDGSRRRWLPGSRPQPPEDDLASYRRLALQLHYDLLRPESPRSVLVVSPSASELSAHSSTALARCLGEELEQSVLLVDACPQLPYTSRMMDCQDQPGFFEVASDPSLSVNDFVLPTNRERVSFLAAGARSGNHAPISPNRLSTFLQGFESSYEFVVLVGGALLESVTSLALAPHVGCVLLLAIEDETRLGDLDLAVDALTLCKARKVGVVLTRPVNSRRLLPDLKPGAWWRTTRDNAASISMSPENTALPFAENNSREQNSDDALKAVRLISAVNSLLSIETVGKGPQPDGAEAATHNSGAEPVRVDGHAAVGAVGRKANPSVA